MPVARAPGFIATATSRIRRLSTPRLIVAVVLVVRLGFVFAFHIHSHLVGQGGFNASPYGGLDDGRYYYETATKLANGTQPDYVLNAFPRVLAFLMRLGIRDLLALKLISYAISSIAVILAATLVWHLTRHLEEAARRWAVIVVSVVGGLFPSNVFWSMNSIMRDGWILSLVLIFLWGTSTAPPYVHRLVRWSIALAALAAAGVFRFYVVPVALAALVSARVPFANPMRGVAPRLVPVLVRLFLVAFTFIIGVVLVAPFTTGLGFNILGWRSKPELLGKGSSLGYSFEDKDTMTVALLYLVSFISNAVGPLLWQIKSANQLLVLTELPFFAIIVVGLFRADWRDPLARTCGLFALYWLLLLGLWNDVLGNAARNRINAWPVLAIVAAAALSESWSTRTDPTRPPRRGLRQLLLPLRPSQ